MSPSRCLPHVCESSRTCSGALSVWVRAVEGGGWGVSILAPSIPINHNSPLKSTGRELHFPAPCSAAFHEALPLHTYYCRAIRLNDSRGAAESLSAPQSTKQRPLFCSQTLSTSISYNYGRKMQLQLILPATDVHQENKVVGWIHPNLCELVMI